MGKKTLPTATSEKKIESNRRNARKSSIIGDNGLQLKEGDNAKRMELNKKLLALPKIDLKDPEAVAQRIGEYFDMFYGLDIKPTVSGLAISLDMYPMRIRDIELNSSDRHGMSPKTLPEESKRLIIKAKHLLENNWETYMLEGKIHPVAGIFLGKNNFGYRDKVEYDVNAIEETPEERSAEDLRKKYMVDAEFVNDSASDSATDS